MCALLAGGRASVWSGVWPPPPRRRAVQTAGPAPLPGRRGGGGRMEERRETLRKLAATKLGHVPRWRCLKYTVFMSSGCHTLLTTHNVYMQTVCAFVRTVLYGRRQGAGIQSVPHTVRIRCMRVGARERVFRPLFYVLERGRRDSVRAEGLHGTGMAPGIVESAKSAFSLQNTSLSAKFSCRLTSVCKFADGPLYPFGP